MYQSDERICLNADKTQIVECGSPEAAFLLVAKGGTISMEDAEKYGLAKVVKTERSVRVPNRPDSAQETEAKQKAEADAKAKEEAEAKAKAKADAKAKAKEEAESPAATDSEGKAVTAPEETKAVGGPDDTKAATTDPGSAKPTSPQAPEGK